jgi:hypothetical protein
MLIAVYGTWGTVASRLSDIGQQTVEVIQTPTHCATTLQVRRQLDGLQGTLSHDFHLGL